MKLTACELKKIIRGPIIWIALIAVIALNIFSILIGGEQSQYSANAPAFRTNIQELQQRYAYFAGPITPEWIAHFKKEAETILNDPQYRVSDDEAERIVQTYVSQYGYSEDAVRNNPILFLNEKGIAEYEKYEDVQVASNFYINASDFGNRMAEYYRNTYPGAKGEALAADTQSRYYYLADEYTANYNYAYGYQKVRNMMTIYPYTIGVVLLIALTPIFSSEYSKRTDALLLTSKNGKKKVVRAKLKAGLLIAIAVWGIVTAINLIVIFSIYGTTGWEAFWQNWVIDVAPFPWTQGQITMIAIATSLLGTIFFACILMMVSSFSKNSFISIIIGAVILLFPMLDFAFTNHALVNMIYNFLPSRILMGVRIWQGFDLFYLVGTVIPYQYIVIIVSIIASIFTVPLTTHFFIKHQVEN